MKINLSKLLINPLFASSMIMIVGSNIVNALNYIYHLLMGRLLGPASYGELAALLSLIGLVGMIPTSLGMVIIKFTSSAKDMEEIRGLFFWLNKRLLYLSLALFITIAIGSPIIASFLNINNPLLVTLSGAIFIFALPALLNRSILQGVLKFKQFVLSMLAENIFKVGLGVLAVYLGYSVLGAVFTLVLTAFLGWIISRGFIRDYTQTNAVIKPKFSPLLIYAIPVILQSISLVSLYTADLILVKHFFTSHEAGIYAALSTLARIIFFGAGPIGAVMFPMVSARHSKGLSYHKVFLFSLGLTLISCGLILLIYWLAPILAINILYGSLYLEAAPLLLFFGISMTLFTISSLFINLHLSLGQTKVVVFPLAAAIMQILGIWFYHQDLREVINVSILVNSLLLSSLLVYFGYENWLNFSGRSSLQTRENNSQGSSKNKKGSR